MEIHEGLILFGRFFTVYGSVLIVTKGGSKRG
jgi:hypothetical protein